VFTAEGRGELGEVLSFKGVGNVGFNGIDGVLLDS
jgi:hypothetical protein